MKAGRNPKVSDDTLLPASRASFGDMDVIVRWDSWCVGLDGQISMAMAKKIKKAKAGRIKHEKRMIEYASDHSQHSQGVLTTTMTVTDGVDSATFDLQLQIVKGNGPSPIIGWGTVGGHKIDLVNDGGNVLIPTAEKVLKVPKVTYKEWDLATRCSDKAKRSIVNAMIEKRYQNEESLFGFSPTSITKR